MQALTTAMPMIVFFIIGTLAVAASILVVAMRNPVHSALFLLLTFLCVAVLFVMLDAEFVGAVQLLVYAGGIMVLFLFVVMLINVRHLPEEKMLTRFWLPGLGVGVAIFILFAMLVRVGPYRDPVESKRNLRTEASYRMRRVTNADGSVTRKRVLRRTTVGNSEAVGMSLYRDYLVPFEVASLFLLVAMIGAIVIGKRELTAEEEELDPQFIIERAAKEKEVKEAVGA